MSAAAAGRAGVEVRSRSAAGSATGGAAAGFAEFDFFFHAAGGFLEFDLEVVAQVSAASLLGRASAAAAEKVFEDAASAAGSEDLAEEVERVMEARAGPGPGALERGVAEAVEGSALVRIDQDVISLRKFLEVFLGLGVARIAVRVVLHGELAVGAFEFLHAGAAGNFEDLVRILAMTRRHGTQAAGPLETMTLAGRRRRSRSL